jgi:hypothetical protein
MPARFERITVVPDRDGQPVRILSFPRWWDRDAFFESFKGRELDLGNPVDWNLAWLLSATEAAIWDERCRKGFQGTRPVDPAGLEEDMRALTDTFRDASWVVVESREWESGLD